jgi:SPX domain protein involved in polyphosphate accumulation
MKYEFKYPIPIEHIDRIRSLILPFVTSDENVNRGDGKAYTVRSIYFDTRDYTYFNEKIEGLRDRKKVRIRGYNTVTPESVVFLEIKRKKDKTTWKHRAPVKYSDLAELLKSGDCERYVLKTKAGSLHDSKRFLYHLHRSCLQPTALIIYNREAYFGKCDRSFRLTLDRDLRGSMHPALDSLFKEDRIRFFDPRYFIMEVKFFDVFPSWLKNVINELELQQKSFSKYANCVLQHTENHTQIRQIPWHHRWNRSCQPCDYTGGIPLTS